MKVAAVIEFTDRETSGEACAIVRYDVDSVALTLSFEANGDLQVVLTKENAKALIAALQLAVTAE